MQISDKINRARVSGTRATQCNQESFAFASVEGRRVEAAFDGGTITSEAGAL